MAGHLVYGLLVVAATASLVACSPDPAYMPHPHMPHLHMPHPHLPDSVKDKLHKAKMCITAQLPKLPVAIAKVLGGCLPAAAAGVPGFAACAARKGVLSAARATTHFAACVG